MSSESQLLGNMENGDSLPPVFYALIKAHTVAALAALIFSALLGIFISTKMHMPDMAAHSAWSSWGRLRFDHTQGIFFGWLGNAFFAFLYHVLPRLSNLGVFSKKLGWVIFGLWNFVVLIPGYLLVLAGFSQPLEWAEFPLLIDVFVVIGLLLSAVQFVWPLLKAKLAGLYVSGWYIIGGLIFTLLAYPVGNICPELIPGAQGAAFSGLWIHDAIGLYVTPLALAIAYWVIPAATKKPIFSHFLSMLGFWLLFFVYPLNGTHHYVYSSIPMEAQELAVAASVILGIDVLIVVANLLLSARLSKRTKKKDLPLRFVIAGTIFYLIVGLQGSVQALMPVNKIIHFSDWVIGHSHLAMIGFASFTAIGGLAHIWQKIPGAKFNEKSLSLSYWFLLAGLLFMVSDLTVAGLVEANLWQSKFAFIESVRQAAPYWLARTISGVPILLSFVFLCIAFFSGKLETAVAETALTESVVAEETGLEVAGAEAAVLLFEQGPASGAGAAAGFPFLNMAYLSASLAGLGFFLLSFAALAVLPGLAIEADLNSSKPKTMMPLSESEEAGRLVYAKEGCAYCHTQQIRKVPADVDRYGMSTRAWETVYDYPQLWGTRRIGPDLARESRVRSDDWQLTHLYNPRLIVRDSIMPPYPWLFNGSPDKPAQEALDLLAYIKSLGEARRLAGVGSQAIPAYCNCPEEVKALEKLNPGFEANANMARALSAEQKASLVSIKLPAGQKLQALEKQGAAIFAGNCASCHGADGAGSGPASASLSPEPADLTLKQLSLKRISFVLENGVLGTSMSAWRDLRQEEKLALCAFVRSLGDQISKTDSKLAAKRASVPQAEASKLFVKNCASCHGREGKGDGPAALALAPRPTDFSEVGPSVARALVVINNGVAGTAMPPWRDQLTLAERAMLARYVSSIFSQSHVNGGQGP